MRLISLLFVCVLLSSCNGNSAKAKADYELALKYLNGGFGIEVDQAKGIAYMQKASDEGNTDAQVTLGYYYLKGSNGLVKDEAKAVELFTKAAEKGHRDAQYNTGLAYVRGQGVKVDFDKAFPWFKKAAYQDDAGSQYNMGVMLLNGEGTVANPLEAFVWFKLAYQKGYDGAGEGMDAARNDMTSEQLKEVDAEFDKISKMIKKPPVSAPEATNPNAPL
jgi:TPR repeat protein